MSIKTLKSIARRGSYLAGAFTVFAALVIPTGTVFADSLNPLTERSLLLSSSAPGFQDSDGSGNTEGSQNAVGEYYAPPGSGPNGKKTGETFSFKVSTDSTGAGPAIKAFTLQYCTSAAGKCQAPGTNTGDGRLKYPETGLPNDAGNADTSVWEDRTSTRTADSATKSDLSVNYTGAVINTDFNVYMDTNADGDYADVGEDVSAGWTLGTSNVEDLTHSGTLTGKNNFITLKNTSGIEPTTGTKIKLVFKATSANHITNPGGGAFFVKINTFDSDQDADILPTSSGHIIDGGVTVANVMTDSIHITTKVLETMSFSVGTRNRDNVNVNCVVDPLVDNGCRGAGATHGTCDTIDQVNSNRLNLGNPDAEYSLETGTAWDVNSYWRLSSNSSGGATVYYSGDTLQNTVGDRIEPIGAAATTSNPGTEQFGLGFVDAGEDTEDAAYTALVDDVTNDRYKIANLTSDGLAPVGTYANATGTINKVGSVAPTATFAFLETSNLVPEVIATNTDNVISCATAKMRYVANIGADTPAGVYTTKINYLAAPQY